MGCAILAVGVVLSIVLNDLVWDDLFIIHGLMQMKGVDGWIASLTSSFWDTSTHLTGIGEARLWRPLSTSVLWLLAQVFGFSPIAFHLLSIAALTGSAASFFLLLTRVNPTTNRTPLLWMALIFFIHPLAIEVTCLSSNVADHLAFIFIANQFVGVYDLARQRKPVVRSVPLIFVLGLGACGSKELGIITVLTPLMVMLTHRTTNTAISIRRNALLWVSCIAAPIVFMVLRGFIVHSALPELVSAPLGAVKLFGFVWGQLIVQSFVPIPVGTHFVLSDTDIAVPAVGAVGVAIGVVIGVRQMRNPGVSPAPLLGSLLAILLLAPSLLAIDPPRGSIIAPTRYLHLPLSGLLLALTPAALRLFRHRSASFIFAAVIALLAILSVIRTSEWRDRVTLWSAERDYHKTAIYPAVNLATALNAKGAFTASLSILTELNDHPQLTPYYRAMVLGLRAEIARKRDGDLQTATALLSKALKLTPGNLDWIFELAQTRAQAQDLPQAIAILEEALNTSRPNRGQQTLIRRKIRFYKDHLQRAKRGATP